MDVTFHLHTPPPKAMAGSIPPQFEPSAPVPYIRIDTGEDPHHRRTHQVISRAATPEDQTRHPEAWAKFQAELAAAAKAKAPPETQPAAPKGAGKK